MLATLAALQLLLFSQAPPLPLEVKPDDEVAQEQAPGPPPELNPPLPNKRGAAPPAPAWPETEPPASTSSPTSTETETSSPTPTSPPTRTTRTPTPTRPRLLSLLSSEPLGGASLWLAWMGYSSLGMMFGQGITQQDDLGVTVDFDWMDTELRPGGFYRRTLGEAGGFDMAGRLTATWYKDLGATWIHSRNHSDHGVEVAPGLSFSARTGGGIFSVIGEAPITVTLKYGGGLLFRPRISLAYEGPLCGGLTLGARLGAGYRAGAGDAPLPEIRADVLFLLLAGYQVL